MMLTSDDLRIGNWQVMRRWEAPLMKVLAREASAHHGDILEVGFGMGFFSTHIPCHAGSATRITSRSYQWRRSYFVRVAS